LELIKSKWFEFLAQTTANSLLLEKLGKLIGGSALVKHLPLLGTKNYLIEKT
jgi:hypothetical protein